MSSNTLPVCPKTGSTSRSLTVHLCLHTVPGNRECALRNNVVFHDYESLSHIGMPLVLFSLVLSYLRQLFGNRPVYCLSIAALWIFCSSS